MPAMTDFVTLGEERRYLGCCADLPDLEVIIIKNSCAPLAIQECGADIAP